MAGLSGEVVRSVLRILDPASTPRTTLKTKADAFSSPYLKAKIGKSYYRTRVIFYLLDFQSCRLIAPSERVFTIDYNLLFHLFVIKT